MWSVFDRSQFDENLIISMLIFIIYLLGLLTYLASKMRLIPWLTRYQLKELLLLSSLVNSYTSLLCGVAFIYVHGRSNGEKRS